MPTARRMLSGVSSALFMALRIKAGLAANRMPSSTNRIPRPMRKSTNAMDLIGPGASRKVFSCYAADGAKRNPPRPSFTLLLLRRRRRGSRPARLARGAAEEAEEIRIRPQQEAGVVGLQALFIGGHRAVEGEEVRILAIS